jgi:hypothetical protein
MPMTLDPGQTACNEAARSMKEADAVKHGHHKWHIGPGSRKSSTGDSAQRIIEGRLLLGELLIAAFLTATTPISFIVLAMATRQRSRGSTEITTPSLRIED